jgi:hypothetical protein
MPNVHSRKRPFRKSRACATKSRTSAGRGDNSARWRATVGEVAGRQSAVSGSPKPRYHLPVSDCTVWWSAIWVPRCARDLRAKSMRGTQIHRTRVCIVTDDSRGADQVDHLVPAEICPRSTRVLPRGRRTLPEPRPQGRGDFTASQVRRVPRLFAGHIRQSGRAIALIRVAWNCPQCSKPDEQ